MRVMAAGLLQKKAQDGTQTTMEATLMAQQTPGQREQVTIPDSPPFTRTHTLTHTRSHLLTHAHTLH